MDKVNTKESIADVVDNNNAVDDTDCSLDELEASVFDLVVPMTICYNFNL